MKLSSTMTGAGPLAKALLVLSLLSSMTAVSFGQTVTLGPAIATPPSSIATARYRLSNTNWDMAILNQGAVTATSSVTVGLGNVAALTTDVFNFTLEYRVGEGLIWSLVNQDPLATPAGGTVAWGTGFSPALPVGAVSAENLTTSVAGGSTTFPSSFNYIGLRAIANTDPASTISISNIAFSGAATVGSISNLTNYSGVTTNFGSLLADSDLGLFDWSLTGLVTATKPLTGSDEGVAFNVSIGSVAIPEPSTYAAIFGLLSLGVVQFRRFRQKSLA